MKAPNNILKVWNQFNHFPMETLTKVWYGGQGPIQYQRTVELMKEHYEKYHITGNCFDLSLWLLDEFDKNGIRAYAIGHDLCSENAHVAVIALDDNNYKYLCDLGDQWIQPICIDENSPHFHSEECHSFFPGAIIEVHPNDNVVEIFYKRPNGKISKQQFHLKPIETEVLWQAAEFSQKLVKPHPLLECRVYEEEECIHWEFYNFHSFSSTISGLVEDDNLHSIEEWAKVIHRKTGYDYDILIEVLSVYWQLKSEI